MSTATDAPLVWIDCELTSLDFHNTRIVEIACVVTDNDLNILGEPISHIIGYSQAEIDPLLSEWSREHFQESGLLNEIYASTTTTQEAQQDILDYISQYTAMGESPLCGNSVGQDRRALYNNMPELEQFLHYRIIDVSTLKELANRWHPEVLDKVQKAQTHRALDDIKESIAELAIYREYFTA
jgi:oligoribonuclease